MVDGNGCVYIAYSPHIMVLLFSSPNDWVFGDFCLEMEIKLTSVRMGFTSYFLDMNEKIGRKRLCALSVQCGQDEI